MEYKSSRSDWLSGQKVNKCADWSETKFPLVKLNCTLPQETPSGKRPVSKCRDQYRVKNPGFEVDLSDFSISMRLRKMVENFFLDYFLADFKSCLFFDIPFRK